MNHEVVIDQPQGEAVLLPEIEDDQSVGVILLVLAVDPASHQTLVWTQLENSAKESTNRKVGQISLPSETRKVDENQVKNMLGALGEFTKDDADIDRLSLVSVTTMPRESLAYGGRPADLAVVFYDGPLDLDHSPVDEIETSPHGWMTIADIQRQNGVVRELAHISLQFALEQRMIEEALERVNLSEVTPLSDVIAKEIILNATSVGEDFHIVDFAHTREQSPDIELD